MAQPYSHDKSYSGDYDYSTIADYVNALTGGASNSFTLGAVQPPPGSEKYPVTQTVGKVIGGVPLAMLTGGYSIPAQVGVNALASGITAKNNNENVTTATALGGLSPYVGQAVGKAAGSLYNGARSLAGGLLGASRNNTVSSLANQASYADVFAQKDALDKLRQLGQSAIGYQDAIRREVDPVAKAKLTDALTAINKQYDSIARGMTMAPDEIEAGLREYLKNSVDTGTLLRMQHTEPIKFMRETGMTPEQYQALSSGAGNVYAQSGNLPINSQNVSLLTGSENLGPQLLPKSTLSGNMTQRLAGFAQPSVNNKADYMSAYQNANAGRYNFNQAVGEKVLPLSAERQYEKLMLQREMERQLAEKYGNLLGTSAGRSVSKE